MYLPKLEYSLSHPYPNNPWFLIGTIVLFLLAVPVLVIVNIVTLGYELVPSLQPQFQANASYAGWWGSTHLPQLLHSPTQPCEPQDLGRGDTFRLTASLFDYTVMSTWNTTETTSASQVQNQKRVEYRGESFANCAVNTTQFDYSLLDDTQTITVGVICPGTDKYPVYISMETKMVFAWLLSNDFVGQYYGPGLDLMNINDTDPNDYRKLAFAALEAISTDSLTVMHTNHLSNPVMSISAPFSVSFVDGLIDTNPVATELTYLNGTRVDWPAEADIFLDSIYNLVNLAAHTVNLDLGSAGPENIYWNLTALNKTILPNLAPRGIAPADWAEGAQTFYYGSVTPPYQTWAQMLLAGQTIKLGNVTGLPSNSSMVTSYLCPSYQLKPMRSLLSSIFVGTASMFLSVWGVWMLVTTIIARRIKPPCLDCQCQKCKAKRLDEGQNGVETSTGTNGGSGGRESEGDKEVIDSEKVHPKHYSQVSYGGSSTKG